MVQIINETQNIWDYKVGINAIIVNFVCPVFKDQNS